MSETGDIMASLRTQLAAACPQRKVTGSLLDFNDRQEADLESGIYTLVAGTEGNFPNYIGREGNFGTLEVLIIAQIKVQEKLDPQQLEEAESEMIDEIKLFTRSAPSAPIDSVVLRSLRRSQQLEHPYGWVAFQMEIMTQ